MNELMVAKKQSSYIDKYNKAVASCNKSAWGLAKVVFETVNSEDFKDVFGTIAEYAKALDVSKGSVSKLAKAYERRALLIDCNVDSAESFNVSQIEEFSKISMEDTMEFVETECVTVHDTVAVIREKAKRYLAEDDSAEVAEDDSAEVAEDDSAEVVEDNSLTILYKGVEYQITNEDIKNKILEILEFDE